MLKNYLYQNAHDTQKSKYVHIQVFTIKNETDIKSVGHNNISRNHDHQRDFINVSFTYIAVDTTSTLDENPDSF